MAPRIEFSSNVGPDKTSRPFSCSILEGPGHYGTGATPAEALKNAAIAWQYHDAKEG